MSKVFRITFDKIPLESIKLAPDIVLQQSTPEHRLRVENLAQDISKNGLQKPIVVLQQLNGEFKLIEGYHRYNACKSLGWEVIDCRIHIDARAK